MANPAQAKFDDQASSSLWIGFLFIVLVFGWPLALTYFIVKLLLSAATSTAMWGNSYRE